ncbi:hypothetical protein MKW98_030549 [Papaver atlanticum]|uniref:Plant heme peroxidase family profile domain-containing protein n=1 Tax=Papaver atlanticum TaxID=357466 RepID=A0AAD4RZ74_9MAGN|nr:hypothetical protein MKW98_016565 [Papaver atlanticum]KAI3926467.1 hypothetical protein MKW98_030549 [Papaver atlanticum]
MCKWHLAGSFDVKSRAGGHFGTMKPAEELSHAAYNELDIAIRLLDPMEEQLPTISYADFLAGVVAVEVTGGPKVPFHSGREVSVATSFFHRGTHMERSDFEEPRTTNPLIFNNSYTLSESVFVLIWTLYL